MPGNKFIDFIMGDELADLDKLAEEQLDKAKKQVAETAVKQKSQNQQGLQNFNPVPDFGNIYGKVPDNQPKFSDAQKKQLEAMQKKAEQAINQQFAKKVLAEPEPAKAVRVFVHSMTGSTTPVIVRAGDRLEIHTKDGYLCAIISLDPNVPEEAQKKAETEAPENVVRIVEI